MCIREIRSRYGTLSGLKTNLVERAPAEIRPLILPRPKFEPKAIPPAHGLIVQEIKQSDRMVAMTAGSIRWRSTRAGMLPNFRRPGLHEARAISKKYLPIKLSDLVKHGSWVDALPLSR